MLLLLQCPCKVTVPPPLPCPQAKRQSTELPNKQQVLELRLRAMQCLTAACAEDRKLEDGRSLR